MGVVQVSNTEIAVFKACRRKWWLSYYRGMRPIQRETTGALPLGARVHKALEARYTKGVSSAAAYRELFAQDRAAASTSEYFDSKAFDSEGDLGLKMVEGYDEWAEAEGIDSDLEVLGVEEIMRAPLLDGAVELTGKIDLRVLKSRYDMQAVMDFKTTKDFGTFDQLSDMQPQLKTYQTLWALTRGDRDDAGELDGGIYRLLRKVKRTASAKPPFYRDVVIRHSIQTLRSYWTELNGVVYDMVAVRQHLDKYPQSTGAVAYPRVSLDCTWSCPFKPICPMFDDNPEGAEQALTDLYHKTDPYDYYGDVNESGTES